ncbi:putative quinone oxidoreductase YhfP [Weizmannia acidilactici]|uniref:Quinone oxidoreductase YhfP n=1 Tax=Weizmannia acidilactici TaxID=2607726 RepID=A0A5J4JE66_9BACI|nr:acryloyl-CoA reductase [Weizmannia acidilactici]GER67499.1 putative quinone oxidoreductase YhfP [Weizmannia acidilactici]GER68700.1 putative quinone oxidoreductase YhfP [Weizmannia acidilactici]GER74254.1 putative quinone oxidoreductase YhfP [Weizmannia acidilactici]
MKSTFHALVMEKGETKPELSVRDWNIGQLPEAEVTVKVAYSSVNYKDALVGIKGSFVKSYPFIPGIDLAGTVLQSEDSRFKEGDEVIVTSYKLGTGHCGGYSEMARVPAEWVVPLPKGLTLKESMILGTAGFTAALSVQKLEDHGLKPGQGPVLVAGASGGVGSVAVDILAKRGYEVAAATGKTSAHDYLKRLGAKRVIGREAIVDHEQKSIRKTEWAAAVDPVGGKTTQYIISTLRYGGAVATSGLTGGTEVTTTVTPFLGRAVSWLGIDSVFCPMDLRVKIWERLASDYKPEHLTSEIVREISLEEVPRALADILEGKLQGRTIVKM